MRSLDLRRAIVDAYTSGRSGSYSQTAALFGVGRATVGRILRRYRETGDVRAGKVGGHRPRAVPHDWLLERLKVDPDARLIDHMEALKSEFGVKVSMTAMWKSVRRLGFSHKKKSRRRVSATVKT